LLPFFLTKLIIVILSADFSFDFCPTQDQYLLLMKIFLLNGNNQSKSLSNAICAKYVEVAEKSGHQIQQLNIADMKFDPVLNEGYHEIQPLETCLEDFQNKLLWCERIVVVYPTWWGGLPAKLKGLVDRSLHSGFAYKYHEKDPLWDKLLKGRDAHIVTTMDAPFIWYFFAYRSAGTHMLKNAVLKFCGISPVKCFYFTRVRYKTGEQLAQELDKFKRRIIKYL
jgi:NAD(P)H dehydrogenase (quinone)